MRYIIDRIILLLYSLSIAVIACLWIAFLLDGITIEQVESTFTMLKENRLEQLIAIAVSLLFLVASFYLIYRAIRTEAGKPRTVDQRTEIGDVRISLETIENLALKAASQVHSLQNTRARIHLDDRGLEIELKAFVDGEESIPERTEEAQRTIRQHLEDITGIPVAKVSIYIANIVAKQPIKSRVE